MKESHPLVIALFFAGAIVLGAVILHPVYILISFCCAALYLTCLQGNAGLKKVGMVLPVWLALSLINPLLNQGGDHVLFHLGNRVYTLEALLYGMAIGGMLVSMLLWLNCFSMIMTTDQFIVLFGSLLPNLSLVLMMQLRLMPDLVRKGRQLFGARRCIGHGAAPNALVKQKAMDGLLILSALLTWALESGAVTADAMNARGYGTGKRSRFSFYKFRWSDMVWLSILFLLIAGLIVLFFVGWTSATYTPVLNIQSVAGKHMAGCILYTIFLSLPSVFVIKEAILWHVSRLKI